MARFFRIVAIILVVLVVLLATAVFAVTRLIDPNDFKPQISALAQEHANLALDIQGDLGWTFWPSLGVNAGRMEARINGDQALFAAIDEASLGVRVWPLLFGRVEMDAVSLSGLYLDLISNEDGGNWERITGVSPAENQGSPETSTADDTSLNIPVSIPQVTLTDSRVRYRNNLDGTDILIEHLQFTASNVQLEEPFPLQVSLRYQDQDDIRIDYTMTTLLGLDPDAQRYQLSSMQADTSIAGITSMPIDIHTEQNVDADIGNQRLRVTDLLVEVAGTVTRGELEITGLDSQPLFRGQLRTMEFDANAALRNIGEPTVQTSRAGALSKIAIDATLSGPANSLMMEPLNIQLDGSTLTGRAGLENLDTGNVVIDLDLDQIVVDDYLPPSDTSTEPKSSGSPAPATLSEAPLLPLDALRALHLEGRVGVGELTLSGFQVSDLALAVFANGGLLELREFSGQTLEGRFDGEGQLDARDAVPRFSFRQNAERLQIQPIAEMLLEEDLFIGLVDLQANLEATGNSEKAIMESAAGRLDFTLTDGTVRGMNLNNVLSNGINQMLADYTILQNYVSGLDDGRRPAALREDTEIVDLTARTRLEDQVVYIEQVDADLEGDGSISGDGWLNIHSNDFDMDLRMRAPGLSDEPLIRDRAWPLRCAGNLADSPKDWCRPGRKAFSDLGEDLVRQLVREEAARQLGVEEEQLDRVEEEARQRIEQEKERVRDDIRERAREELEKLFR